MAIDRTLNAEEIREIGEALYGRSWQGAMAQALGVPRQSVGYYLKSGGVDRTQAAGIIGLVARTAAHEMQASRLQQTTRDERQAVLAELLARFDPV